MRNQGIGSWTARRARKTPGRTAVEFGERTWTYGQLHERVLRLAHALRGLGVRRGDRIAYLGPNHPSLLETLFAAGTLGAVFVPLNFRLAAPELAYDLTDSGSAALIHPPDLYEAAEVARDAGVRHRITLDDAARPARYATRGAPGPWQARGAPDPPDPPGPPEHSGPYDGALGYEALLASAGTEPLDELVPPTAPCMIMYTSGTTGRPKGAVLSHANITWNSVNVLVDTDIASDEITLVAAPLFHTAALNMICLPTLLKGGRVLLARSFDPAHALELIETRRVTCMFGVPTMYDAMAAQPVWPGTDLSSLRTLNCGGAPVPDRTIAAYLARGLAFSQGYGMTEAAPGVLYLSSEMASAKAGSAGVPHFFTDARVVGGEGRDTAPGEKGEIIISGPHVMDGYWGRPEETATAFTPGGWFRTGDVARVDEDGYAFIVGRVKDMYISGGENVYPAEVENAILDHPAVDECAVIGVPDAQWGEVGCAVVVRSPDSPAGEREILASLDGRLAKYKIPKSVVLVDELPRTASGKVVKSALRSAYGPAHAPRHGQGPAAADQL